VDEVDARVGILDRSYYPRFNFQSAVSGRGSGADVNGSVASGANGLGLERYNWAAGMAVTFPLFDFASIHARKQIELANERAEAARYDQTIQDLTGQLERVRAALEGARRVAQNTPVQLQAARATESQARTRYQAGLSTIVEVAEAQSLLVRAETDDALARLAVWLDLASLAEAQGDLEPFMQLLRKRAPGGP
jgi:outer membrane protein TolC